jgi:hypothetical protein
MNVPGNLGQKSGDPDRGLSFWLSSLLLGSCNIPALKEDKNACLPILSNSVFAFFFIIFCNFPNTHCYTKYVFEEVLLIL